MIGLLSFSDLVTHVTPDQAETTILNVAKSVSLPVSAWRPGGVIRTIIKIFAIIYATFTQIVALVAGGGYLDTSVGVWLTYLARTNFGVNRIFATFAAVAQGITLTNTKGGLWVIEPGDLQFSATIGGVKKLYRNTSGGTLNPGPGTTLTLDIQATEAGTSSNAAPGVILTLETQLLGVTCTNPLAVVGQDDETDPSLRQRCRDSLGALSPNGPKQAYRFMATSAVRVDGSAIGVTRVKIPVPPGDGSMTVIVATASGAVPGTVGDLTSDLGIIDADIQSKVVPQGVGPVLTESAGVVAIAVHATVYVDVGGNLDTPTIQGLVDAALVDYFKTTPIGGFILGSGDIFVKALEGVIRQALAPWCVMAVVTTPAANVPLSGDQIPVESGPATLTVNQVVVQA